MKKHYRKENDCLNCGAELCGKYCHNCGQENLEIRESFGHMVNHAVSDYFHFDHQFFHTLKPLLFKPGKLTLEYLAGRRAQYLHPVKMYIFISLIYFLLIFKSNHEVIEINKDKKPANTETAKSVKDALDKKTNLTPAQKTEVKKALKNVPAGITMAQGVNLSGAPVKIMDDDNDNDPKRDTSVAQYQAKQDKLPADERDGFWSHFYHEKKLAYQEKYGKNWNEHFKEDIQHNISKMMFVLLPLFALILKLAFWKNHRYYVEHLIYAIHLHCFFFLFSAIILIIQMLIPESWDTLTGWLSALLFFYTLWYIYRSFRILYHRSRWRTVSKMIGVAFMYLMVFSFCVTLLVMFTAAIA